MRTIHTRIAALASAFLIFVVPFGASAASTKPTCSITITTEDNDYTFTQKDTKAEVVVAPDTDITIEWKGKNTKEVVDSENKKVDVSDSDTIEIAEETEIEYTFKNGSKKVICVATLIPGEADITSSLSTDNEKPSIAGTAEGLKSVYVLVTKEGSNKKIVGKSVKVKSGEWATRSTKKLADGEYTVKVLSSRDSDATVLDEETLTVGEVKGDAKLAVASIPLLTGGTTRAGQTIPVAYLRVTNTGTTDATVTGFQLTQRGTASVDSAITELTVVDDKGGSRGAVTTPFKKGVGFATTHSVIPAGQMRLYTVKAVLGTNASSQIGKLLMLDVTGVGVKGTVRGSFPILGTTWTIGY